jgi:hypothetical protein
MVTVDVSVGKRGMDRKTWADTFEFKLVPTPARRPKKRKDLKNLAFITDDLKFSVGEINIKKSRIAAASFKIKEVD